MARNPTRAARILRFACITFACIGCRASDLAPANGEVPLPAPRTSSSISLEAAFGLRRPVRAFGPGELSTTDVAQLLWASRAAPAIGPIALDVYAARSDGVIRYSAATHTATRVSPLDVRKAIAQASGEPEDVRAAPVLIVLVGQPAKARTKYGDRADRFAAIEAGHAAQNILLQAGALGLAATPLALFDDAAVRETLVLPAEHLPLHILAVGRPLSANP